MSFVNISAIRTADPASVQTPKTSFLPSDPFAIVMDIQVDSSVIQSGLRFDAVFQIVNPRQDPLNHAWFHITSGSTTLAMPTIDFDWTGVSFQWGTNFWIWFAWTHYSDAVHVSGPDRLNGIFFVQGTVSVEGSDLFARSGQFWFKVRA